MERLAQGGVGLLCTAPAAIGQEFRANQYQLCMADQDAIDSFKPLLERIHHHGAKIFLYADYSDRQIARLMLLTSPDDSPNRKEVLSAMQEWVTSGLSSRQIAAIVNQFRDTIRRAMNAGFDGILLNSYLGAFLQNMSSKRFNQRRDEWGGDLKGRLRIFREIIEGCKSSDAPVMVRWNLKDYEPGGMTVEEGAEACLLLETYGADALEIAAFGSVESVSTLNRAVRSRNGLPLTETQDLLDYYRIMHPFVQNQIFLERRSEIKVPLEYVWGHAFFNVRPLKKILHIPISIVGGVRTRKMAEKIISQGCCDLISMVRVLIHNPDLCREFEEGSSLYSSCISCNVCMNRMFASLEDPSRPYLHRCVISGNTTCETTPCTSV